MASDCFAGHVVDRFVFRPHSFLVFLGRLNLRVCVSFIGDREFDFRSESTQSFIIMG